MRILILSDIHGNLEALDACLSAAPRHDRVFNLGDIVGYGANPNEVIEKSLFLDDIFVRGNHDKACSGLISLTDFNPVAAMAALWTHEQLTAEHLEFLRRLPKGPIMPVDNLACVHGSPRDEDEYVFYPHDAYAILAQTEPAVTFFGHTHVQGAYWIDGHPTRPKPGRPGTPVDDAAQDQGVIDPRYPSAQGIQTFSFHLKKTAKYLVNPGSVGQPRDGDPRAAFASYDTEAATITLHRVPYDIQAAQNKILTARLPERLAFRLEEGR